MANYPASQPGSQRHTLSVLVENAPGVLSQVSRLFSRKGYNIESLAVGTTDDPAISRITIEVLADNAMIEQIMNQLRKQFPVYSVQELLPERSIRRELVMFKVRAETPDIRNEIIQIANIFRASIIDVSLKSLTLALIGDETKAEAMQRLLEAFGILELVRTGMVALERAPIRSATRTRSRRNLIWERISCKIVSQLSFFFPSPCYYEPQVSYFY